MAALQGPSDRLVLESSTFTIGRAPDNQIVLNDGRASSRHAVLQLLGEEYSITDLGSSNGTYINESLLAPNTPTTLRNGDRIRIGDTTYIYEGNRQAAPGHDPTVMAGSPPYEATVLASPPQAGFPGQGMPSSPQYSQPGFPGQGMPSSPQYSQPGFPEQGMPSSPQYSQPGFPGQGMPSSPQYSQSGFPGQGTPSSPQYPQSGFPGQGTPSSPQYSQPGFPGQGTPSSPQYSQSGFPGQGTPSSPQYPATVAGSATPPPAYPTPQADSYAQQGFSQGYQQPAPPYSQPGFPPPAQPYQQPGQPGQFYQQPGQPWGELPPGYSQPAPAKKGGMKTLIIVLVILLVLGAGGGGTAYYFATRPQPTITVSSQYTVGTAPAGATDTELNVSGQKFSGNSTITFLLDNSPVAGASGQSDSNGALTATLKITDAWSVGNHTLTAKDASGYVTAAGKAITIVTPGQAHTPGPHGAPSDDVSGTIVAKVTTSDGSETINLTVTGKDDGGTVCRDFDDGQPHQSTGTSSGLAYTETITATCEGTYKGGKLTYTETVTSDRVDIEGGYVCQATKPYVFHHLEGTFTDKTTVNGTFSSDAVTVTCNKGLGSNTTNAGQGTWTGVAALQ